MNTELAIAIGGGLGGMLGWGLADFFAKKTIDEIGDITTLVWAHVLGSAGLVVLLAAYALGNHGLALPSGAGEWGGIAVFGLLQGIIYMLVYQGFGKGPVAVLNPIYATYSGVVALVSVIAGEAISLALGGWFALMFIGIMLVSLDISGIRKGRLKLSTPGFMEVASAAVLAAGWTLGWNAFVGGKNGFLYGLLMYIAMTIGVVVIVSARRTNVRFSRPTAWKFLALIGATEIVAYAGISYGFSQSDHVALVALLSGAFSVPTVLLARLFLREQVQKVQYLGIGAILLGLAGITLR